MNNAERIERGRQAVEEFKVSHWIDDGPENWETAFKDVLANVLHYLNSLVGTGAEDETHCSYEAFFIQAIEHFRYEIDPTNREEIDAEEIGKEL